MYCAVSLKDKTGREKVEDQDILQVASEFYADLYKSNACTNEVVDDYIKSSTLERSLSDLDKLKCEGEISYNECEFAVKGMKKK